VSSHIDNHATGLHQQHYHWEEGEGELVHHSAGSQYTSFRFTQHLHESGIHASIGTVGDALDNALTESTICLYKTEFINPASLYRTQGGSTAGGAHLRAHTVIGHIGHGA
jgi:transposase InsO family protein